MDLNLIKKPVITEKSTANAQFNKYIFEVRNDAHKINIKKTIRGFFKINDWYISENITKYISYI